MEVEPPELAAPYATAERLAIQAEARRFSAEVVLPVANELDPVRGEIPRELIDAIARQGYFGITVPSEHGGMGLGVLEYCVIAEELARSWMSVASIIARAQGLGTGVADDARREELLRRSARGEWIGAIAFSEPDAGSDLAAVRTRAVLDGDEYVVTGQKRWCGNAKARTSSSCCAGMDEPLPDQSRAAGLATMVVEKRRGEFPAAVTGHPIDKIGYHGFVTWHLDIDGLRVPASNVLAGGPDSVDENGTEAFRSVQETLNVARVHTAARAVGLARAAVEDCTVYLQEREQFGHPIGDFQALRFLLAEMAARVTQARAFYQQIAHRLDLGEECVEESAMVKLVASEMAADVTAEGLQLHGGNGYTTEHQVERHWRDARLTTIFEGTSQIQQKIVADRLLPPSPLG